jgi:mannan endo-1,4-beta-mannosidase
MTPLEDKLRAAFRAQADEIGPVAPPLRLPARRPRSLVPGYGGAENRGTPARRAWHGWIAPAASAVMVAAVIAASALAFGGSRFASSSPARAPAAAAIPAPSPSSYLGVFETGAPPSFVPVEEFAQAVGKEPNLVGYFSGWAQPFAASYARMIRQHGAIIMVQIDPTLASVSAIASGADDDYLRSYADSVRAYGHPVVIGFGHDMNATWYSWGYTHTPAPTFVKAWRHIVTLFRQQGADNVTWLWTIQADQPGTGPVLSWWPGANYVTWVGIDGFYTKPSDTFPSVFGPTIAQVRTLTPKPILLSETAVARHANQYANILNLFSGIAQYGTLGLVWLDQDQSHQAIPQGAPADSYQDWRIEQSPLAERAFRLSVSGMTLART